jgi:hypothetical protein
MVCKFLPRLHAPIRISPVIAMSGAFGGQLLRFASTFGVPTLEKPFTVSTLLKAVESALLKKASSDVP